MENLNTIWTSLDSEARNSKGRFLLRKRNSLGLHIGIDLVNRHRVIVLETHSEVDTRDFPRWKGLLLSGILLDNDVLAILASLVDNKDIDIFNALVSDLEGTLKNEADSDRAVELFVECLDKWHRFFDRYGSGIMSNEMQMGLFGELYFLKNHVLPLSQHIDAVQYWRGHARKYQDFSFPSGNVEVKTTAKKEPRSVIVNSEKQLDSTGLNSLYLYCLAVNELEQTVHSLPLLVEEIRQLVQITPKALSLFNGYLNEAGYLDEHECHYCDKGYAVLKEYLFKVEEGFPRITDVPAGIGDIKYSVLVSACEKFKVAIDTTLSNLVQEKL